jgi:hypothetical protein
MVQPNLERVMKRPEWRAPMSRLLGLTLALALGLAGCVSPAERFARDQATCTHYGFEAGSGDFATCLMIVDQERKNRQAAEAAAWDAQAQANFQSQYLAGQEQAQQAGQSWHVQIPMGGNMYTTWP